MKEEFTGWETTRLSKHFILLDFLADRAVYRSELPLSFDETWNDERDALAKGLCKCLLERLIEAFGPFSVADAFWPASVANKRWPKRCKLGHRGSGGANGPKHLWTGGEATVDIALYDLMDDYKSDDAKDRAHTQMNAVTGLTSIDGCRDRVLGYSNTEFLCVTYKIPGEKKRPRHIANKSDDLRAHHVRVGRYFNLLDFCRSGRAVERGIDLVPKGAENNNGPVYSSIREESAARSFAAVLDPLVEEIGRISVVRGIETDGFADDEHAELHRWDRAGPWRLVFVLPQGTDPEEACDLLRRYTHVRDVQPSRHPSDSWSLALVVDRHEYREYCGLRPVYSE